MFGKVRPLRKHTAATGYQVDLYKVEGVPEDLAHDFEQKFMAPVDNMASDALQLMISRPGIQLDERHKSAWARFIMSLIYRNPVNVSIIRDHITALWATGLDDLQEAYTARRSPGDPETFAEFEAQLHPGRIQTNAANFLAEVMDNPRLGATLVNMQWTVIDVGKSKFSLLTSDRPFIMPIGVGDPNAYVLVPVAPDKLFVAAHKDQTIAQFNNLSQTALVKGINVSIVSQAREFVWGKDDSQLEFVRRHLGSAPEREILTEAQRKEALDIVRGAKEEIQALS
jgi:hypothetical protein